MMRLVFIFCLLMLTESNGFILGNGGKWDGLRVTWGLPLSKNSFSSMPRTVHDATREGFVKISNCDNNQLFKGDRYVRNGDYAVVLIFDKNGFIAGIQAGVKASGYPFRKITPPFVKDGDHHFITAYFGNPSNICSRGRSSSNFHSEGTGVELLLQNGPNPTQDLMKIPMNQHGLSGTKWVEGKCFPSMGVHYWHNLHTDTDCENLLPMFLLYNGGKLNAFGWAFIADLSSTRYEHPGASSFTAFMNDVPQCLKDAPKISTMHIYLTDKPALNLC